MDKEQVINEFEKAGLIEQIYPSKNPDKLEISIEKYIARDLLGTMLIYELLKTKNSANIFVNWLEVNDKKIEFEDAIVFIINLRIKETGFEYKKANTNMNLFNAAKEKDPKHYLNDEQIAYLIEITKENENEAKVLKDLTRTEDNNLFKENDLRWLIFNLIMPDDEDK